jgi:hypothetical protein
MSVIMGWLCGGGGGGGSLGNYSACIAASAMALA